MRKIKLIEGVHSSLLGFGCAPILGSIDGPTAEKAIHLAMDNGVNHFDLARSYGYGEAEAFVGKVLKNKRKEVVIVTKFGIMANWKSTFLKPIKPLVRLIKGHPKIKTSAPSAKDAIVTVKADRFLDRLPITASVLENSLEKSLKALNSDYVDILFIHEPLETVQEIESVIAASQKLKKAGKIRGFGLAFMQNQIPLHKNYLNEFDILQFNNSPGIDNYENMKLLRGEKNNILFSPLNGGVVSLSPAEKLKKLSVDFPNSVILCSMFSEKHIKSNTGLFN